MTAAHLQLIEYYIQKRRHTVHTTICGRDVLKECEGTERRRGTSPRLFWAQQDMMAPEPREYGPEEGEDTTSTPSVSRARVAPQARPTITGVERPREAMPVSNPELEARWNAAHIND